MKRAKRPLPKAKSAASKKKKPAKKAAPAKKKAVKTKSAKPAVEEARRAQGRRRRRRRHAELQAAVAPHARRLRRHGRRHVGADRAGRPPHHLAGARERAEELHRGRRFRPAQAQGGDPDRPAAEPHALQFAGDLREHHGGRLPDPAQGPAAGRHGAVRHLGAGKAAVDLVLRLLGRGLARRAPALVLRRRIRAHGVRLAGLEGHQPARRPVLPHHRRAQSVEADRGRPLAHAGHQAGRQRDAAAAPSARQGLSRPQLQRLSAAPGPLLPRLYRRRDARHGHLGQEQSEADLVLDQLAALHRLHAYGRAAVRPRPDAGDRRSPPRTTPRTGRSWSG